MRRTSLALFAFALAGLALGACTKEHDALLGSFPLPVISEARLVDPQSVQLEWSVADAAGVDEYRVYVGIYANLGFAVLDSMAFFEAAPTTRYLYVDPGLSYVDEDLCDQVGLCDSLYTYTYFRVSAVRGGSEGVPGPRVFITP